MMYYHRPKRREQTLETVALGQLDIYVEKKKKTYEIEYISHPTLNHLQQDYRPKCERQNSKLFRG